MKHSSKIFILFFTLICAITINAQPRVSIISPLSPKDPIHDFLGLITTHNYFAESELIVITTDSCEEELAIIKKYQKKFSNIYCIIGITQNISGKLFNEALQSSNADIITFMRVEDYRDPHLFLSQLQTLENNDSVDIVYSDYYTSYSPNTPTDKADNWYLNELPEFNPQWLYRDIPGPHAMWRKSLHAIYGYLKEDFQFHYLWEFWNRCAQHNVQFKKVTGKPGTFHFNYFNQKKLLFGSQDFEQSYYEEQYIRHEYSALWSSLNFEEKPFVIVTASYNNKDWYKRNLDSVLNQNYSNYRIIYIDDKSSDSTGNLVQEYCTQLGKENKIKIIVNKENIGALANIYNAVHSCSKHEIIILLDGDDWLAHNDVLKHLNMIYQDTNVWLTYGQFQWFPAQMPGFVFEIPRWVIERNSIREYRWITTHLRSFYAGLFHKIKKEDLLYENKFYPMAGDLGIMYPMVEMAGYHTRFVPEILYIYNSANQINDNKKNLDLQDRIDKFIRGKAHYQPITSLF